jgi:hypothetical protein
LESQKLSGSAEIYYWKARLMTRIKIMHYFVCTLDES